MSKKSLFTSSTSEIKKKKVFMLRADLLDEINQIEKLAEKIGFSFPLNQLVEDSVARLLRQARAELADINPGGDENVESALEGRHYDK